MSTQDEIFAHTVQKIDKDIDVTIRGGFMKCKYCEKEIKSKAGMTKHLAMTHLINVIPEGYLKQGGSMTDQTTPMKQDPMVAELFDSELGQNIESSIMRSHSEFCLSTDNCNCNELMDKFKQKVSQLLLQKEQEVREGIKAIDLNEEGRHMTIGELFGDLIDSLK